MAVSLAALAILLNVPITNAAEVDSKTTLQERHAHVVKMPSVERQRLERNLAEFQKMTPEQQAHYRQLNTELEENRNGGGHLTSLMQTYSAWLQTLTPGQREELRNETDSVKKLALVHKFKSEQVQRSFDASPSIETLPPAIGPRLPHLGRLNFQELNSLMEILAAELPEEEREEIGRINKLHQHPEILRRSIQHAENTREWPSEEVQQKLIGKVPPRLKPIVLNNNRREMLIKLMAFSFSALVMDEAKPSWPTEKELEQVYEQLDAKQQKMIDQKPIDERPQVLIRRFFEQNPERAPKQLEETKRKIESMLERVGVELPPRPYFDGQRQGDRRPPDRRPGERRPEEQRYGDQPPPPERPDRERPRPDQRPEPRRDRNENKKETD